MNGLNKVLIIGNLGKAPEMKYTPSGKAVTTFSVAVNRSSAGADGQRSESTEWFAVVTWEALAERCNQYLERGSQVYVEGRLQTRSWDGEDGQKHYRTEVVAHEVLFLGAAKRDRAGAAADEPPVDGEPLPF